MLVLVLVACLIAILSVTAAGLAVSFIFTPQRNAPPPMTGSSSSGTRPGALAGVGGRRVVGAVGSASTSDRAEGCGSPDEALLRRLAQNADDAVAAWASVLDSDDLYESKRGVTGSFRDFKRAACMYDWVDVLKKAASRASGGERSVTNEWKAQVATGFGRLLDGDGLPASKTASGMSKRWCPGYTFHLIRNRFAGLDQRTSGGARKALALALAWPGGDTGAGSKLVRYILTDPHVLVKPSRSGDVTRVLDVDAEWLKRQVSEGGFGKHSDTGPVSSTKAKLHCGLFLAWPHLLHSFHGSWDCLFIINELHEASGEAVFALVPQSARGLIGEAVRNLRRLVASGAHDGAGYGASDMAQWRGRCKEELARPGVGAILKW